MKTKDMYSKRAFEVGRPFSQFQSCMDQYKRVMMIQKTRKDELEKAKEKNG